MAVNQRHVQSNEHTAALKRGAHLGMIRSRSLQRLAYISQKILSVSALLKILATKPLSVFASQTSISPMRATILEKLSIVSLLISEVKVRCLASSSGSSDSSFPFLHHTHTRHILFTAEPYTRTQSCVNTEHASSRCAHLYAFSALSISAPGGGGAGFLFWLHSENVPVPPCRSLEVDWLNPPPGLRPH